jgi:hypothetical protein
MFKPKYVQGKSKSYNAGLKTEAAVLNFLTVHCAPSTVVKSSYEDDVIRDIDAYLGGMSISVKADHKALKTGNICLELEVSKGGKHWERSHFYKPKDFYVFAVGRTIYLIGYDALKRYVSDNGWYIKTQLSRKVIASQIAMGHKHVNAKLGLLRIKDLVEANVAVLVTDNFVESNWLNK